jgi:cadmium resistance protein CadD (predicted permease)
VESEDSEPFHGAFISTNLEDLFILIVWFSQTNNVLHKKHIVAGQYLGFTALVLLSLLVSLAVLFIPKEWVGLLGFVPLYMAYKLWREQRTEENKEDVLSLDTQNKLEKISFLNVFTNQNTYRIASITFADCADNISIYTQIFKSASHGELLFDFRVYAVGWGMVLHCFSLY